MPSQPLTVGDNSFGNKALNMFSRRSSSLSKTPSITRRFLSGSSKSLGNETSLALKYQHEADKLHERGDWEKAIDRYQQCIKYAPENGYLWTSMYVFSATCLLVILLRLTFMFPFQDFMLSSLAEVCSTAYVHDWVF